MLRTFVPFLVALAACHHSDPSDSGDGDADTDADSDADADADSDADSDTDADTDVFTGELGTVMFVTQVPIAGFASGTSTFANHIAAMDALPRGGDLMIRYPDGTLRNLTREAGFGSANSFQGATSIAVREPSVHWSGNKALFAMVIGAPEERYVYETYRWQLYEVTGLAEGETASIRHIDNQPADYDNVSPIYGTDDRILFTSDRPRSGEAHLFPLLDEYESAASITGLWSLDEASGDLKLIEHAPSGVFSPSIDSAGRVIFTKWDHLQRDQQGDTPSTASTYHPLTWDDESAGAAITDAFEGSEVFPEARVTDDPTYDSRFSAHGFNQFFPWTCDEDGSEEETVDHVGRHELGGSYSEGSYVGDRSLDYTQQLAYDDNTFRISSNGGLLQLKEDPAAPGTYLATYAPEFYTAAGGPLIRMTAPDGLEAEEITLEPLTSAGTWRDPLPMSDGTLVAAYTASEDYAENGGTTAAPSWNYDYRLVIATGTDGSLVPGGTITEGITRDLHWWSPDVDVHWSGTLWELEPVEVAPRARPTRRVEALEAPEAAVFADVGVDLGEFQDWLRANDLALIVSRNVTQRDRADVQQPYNLRVPNGVSSRANNGTMYDIAWLQIFQADQVRGYGDVTAPNPGRRVLARPMHEPGVSTSSGPPGAVPIALDGSIAALVPGGRALTWQTASPDQDGVVRERNWVSFPAGEVRTCAVCHGLNTESQTGDPKPTNEPEALRALLTDWKASH
jgi:hypothetical protein